MTPDRGKSVAVGRNLENDEDEGDGGDEVDNDDGADERRLKSFDRRFLDDDASRACDMIGVDWTGDETSKDGERNLQSRAMSCSGIFHGPQQSTSDSWQLAFPWHHIWAFRPVLLVLDWVQYYRTGQETVSITIDLLSHGCINVLVNGSSTLACTPVA